MDDDVTNQRFSRIEQRLDDMPKAMATAFTVAFDNARQAIMQDADARLEAFEARAEARMQAFEARTEEAASRRHGEMMRKFQQVIDEAIALRDQRFAAMEERLAKLEAAAVGARQ